MPTRTSRMARRPVSISASTIRIDRTLVSSPREVVQHHCRRRTEVAIQGTKHVNTRANPGSRTRQSYLPKISTALCPPNPNELLMTIRMSCFLDLFGT